MKRSHKKSPVLGPVDSLAHHVAVAASKFPLEDRLQTRRGAFAIAANLVEGLIVARDAANRPPEKKRRRKTRKAGNQGG